MFKIALIGIGGMGNVHFNAYRRMKNAEVIAVADVRVDMAKEKTAGTNAKIYASLDELLKNEKPDVVDICTPSYMHTEMAIKALNAGCHVLSEKPMSVSSADTARVIETAKKVGKHFMTAHVVRFMAPYVYLANIIKSGELGKPVHFDMTRISAVPRWSWEDWMRDVKKSGGTPIDLSIHDLDFIYSVFGEPKAVNGIYQKLDEGNDYITSNLVYDGFSVTVMGGWYNADIPFNASYRAIFQNGYIDFAGGVLTKGGEVVDLGVKEESVSETEINIPRADGYADEIEYFLDCIEKDIPNDKVTPESSEGIVKLIERILASTISV